MPPKKKTVKKIAKKKPLKKGKWKKRIATGVVIGAVTVAAGCTPAKKQQFIMRDLNQSGNRGKVFTYVPQEFQQGG